MLEELVNFQDDLSRKLTLDSFSLLIVTLTFADQETSECWDI